MAPGFPVAKGERNRRVERFALTTSCYSTEATPAAQAEAQLLLEPMLERNLCGETASDAVHGVLGNVLAMTPVGTLTLTPEWYLTICQALL